jgi:hypothetical protein
MCVYMHMYVCVYGLCVYKYIYMHNIYVTIYKVLHTIYKPYVVALCVCVRAACTSPASVVYVRSMYAVYSMPVLAEPQPLQGDWQSQPRTCTWPLAESFCASRQRETPPVTPLTFQPIINAF